MIAITNTTLVAVVTQSRILYGMLSVVGNVVLLTYVVVDDPRSLYWVAGLLALGVALYLAQRLTAGRRRTGSATSRGA